MRPSARSWRITGSCRMTMGYGFVRQDDPVQRRRPTKVTERIQTCLTKMVLFGIAPRQTKALSAAYCGCCLSWAVPDFSTHRRCQKTLKVNIPTCGSLGPLHLLIDSTGIKIEGEASGTLANMAAPKAASGAISTSG